MGSTLKWIFKPFSTLLLFSVFLNAEAPHSTTILDVTLNGIHHHNMIVIRTGNGLCIPLQDLPELSPQRLPADAILQTQHTECVDFSSVPGAVKHVDEKKLSADIVLPAAYLKPQTFSASNETVPKPASTTGFNADYNLFYQQDVDTYSYGTGIYANLFSPYGILRSGYLHRGTEEENSDIRLDTLYVLDMPQTIQSLKIGDMIGGSSALSGGYRLGGVQFARDFSTRPDMLTMPLPSYTSSAALPSAVDAFVNGAKVYQKNVEPGPFEINRLPSVDGEGILSVVVNDVYGVQQVATIPFYTNAKLLQTGLSDYSFEAGYLRYNYGKENFDYRDFISSGFYRLGLNDSFTAEVNALTYNDSGGRFGLGGTLLLLDFLSFDASAAVSEHEGKSGQMGKIGLSRKTRRYSFSAQSQWASESFLQPGYDGNVLRSQSLLYAGYTDPYAGSFSTSYVNQKYETSERTQMASVGYSKTISSRLFFNLTMSYIIAPESDMSALASLTIPLGRRTTMTDSAFLSDARSEARITLQQNLPTSDGYGYRLSGAYTDPARRKWSGEALGSYQNRYALFNMGAASYDGRTAYRGSMDGSVTVMENRMHFNRQANEAFGIVSLDGLKGVRVYSQNQLIGETDSSGYLFIPSLLPYQRNKVAIDPRDIPFDYRIGQTETYLTPYRHSGISYSFAVEKATSVIMHVIRPSGVPVAYGSALTVDGKTVSVAGKDGLVFLETLQPGEHLLRIEDKTGECNVHFYIDETASSAFMTELGKFVCGAPNE